jgi:DNA-binding NarL/FixJ family response regulator
VPADRQILVSCVSSSPIIRDALIALVKSLPDCQPCPGAVDAASIGECLNHCHPAVVLVESTAVCNDRVKMVMKAVARRPQPAIVVLADTASPIQAGLVVAEGATGLVLKSSTSDELVAALIAASAGNLYLDKSISHREEYSRFPFPRLSAREQQIFICLVRGLTNVEIARSIGVSAKTVETFRLRLFQKLKIKSRAELVDAAVALGCVSIDDACIIAAASQPITNMGD